jgi:hypothetical protein
MTMQGELFIERPGPSAAIALPCDPVLRDLIKRAFALVLGAHQATQDAIDATNRFALAVEEKGCPENPEAFAAMYSGVDDQMAELDELNSQLGAFLTKHHRLHRQIGDEFIAEFQRMLSQ